MTGLDGASADGTVTDTVGDAAAAGTERDTAGGTLPVNCVLSGSGPFSGVLNDRGLFAVHIVGECDGLV